MRPIDAARIPDAARVIDPVFLRSALVRDSALDRLLHASIACKVESLNPIRSFKGRGTEYLVHELLAGRAHGIAPGTRPVLVCASAGNFGQGLARAGVRRGLSVTVVAATTANPLKVAAMRALGADVQLAGDDFDAAKAAARTLALERGAVFVEDGAWPEVAEGAGTIAHELTEALPHAELPEVMLVPLGNGALLTGIGAWLRHASPATRIIGVAAAGAPSMQRSFAARRTVSTPSVATIADGIAVREPVPYAVDAMPALVDDVVLVSEGAIVAAMRLLHEQLGLVIEPAGAVGIAALLGDDGASMHPWRGARIATPLCGGNVTAEQVQRWLLP